MNCIINDWNFITIQRRLWVWFRNSSLKVSISKNSLMKNIKIQPMQVLVGRYPFLSNIYKKLPPQENGFLIIFLFSSDAPNKNCFPQNYPWENPFEVQNVLTLWNLRRVSHFCPRLGCYEHRTLQILIFFCLKGFGKSLFLPNCYSWDIYNLSIWHLKFPKISTKRLADVPCRHLHVQS